MACVTLWLGDCAGEGRGCGKGVPACGIMELVLCVVCEASREIDGRVGRVWEPCAWRGMSSDCRAGVDVPDALCGPLVAAARSADACETPPMGTLVALPTWPCVDRLVAPLPAPLTLVEGVGMLLVLRLEEERCRRDGVGWVAPVI